MRPFEDGMPEEMAPQNEELVAWLRRVHHRDALPPAEQEQVVARVRARLLAAPVNTQREDANAWLQHTSMPRRGQERVYGVRHGQEYREPGRMRARLLHGFNTLAAVLVVAMIVGAALLLFAHRPQTVAGPTVQTLGAMGPVGSPVTVSARAGGLEASISVTPGPYFLNELLAINLSLSNHTQTTFSLQGVAISIACGSALEVTMGMAYISMSTSRETAPHEDLTQWSFDSCPKMPMRITKLQPGQTIVIRQYQPLTDGLSVTPPSAGISESLTESAHFLKTVVQADGSQLTTDGPSPLDGHWPKLSFDVTPQVPQDRMVVAHLVGSHLLVSAPAWARLHLLYRYNVVCQDWQGPGITRIVNATWAPQAQKVIDEPACSGKHVQWMYTVGAPGYAIDYGSYPPAH